MSKVAIPVINSGNAEVDRLAQAVKQALEGISGQGQNSAKLVALTKEATPLQVVNLLNSVIKRLGEEGAGTLDVLSSFGADIAALTVLTSVNGGQLAGHRRKNLNGDCSVAQAGTSFAGLGTGTTWTLDGYAWEANSDAVVTAAQSADAPADNEFQFSHRVTVTTADAAIAATQYAMVDHPIEGYDARELIGRDFTISFWVRSAKTGVHCLSLRNSGFDRNHILEYTVNAANTWEKKSVRVTAGLITAGTWNWINGTGLRVQFVLACGTTYQGAAGSWITGTYLATANQVNCLDTIGNIFAVTGVQIEPGPVATPFEHRLYESSLAHAMRYYQQKTQVVTTTSIYSDVHFHVRMRAAPTITATFDAGTGGSFATSGSFDQTNSIYQLTNHSSVATADIRLSARLA